MVNKYLFLIVLVGLAFWLGCSDETMDQKILAIEGSLQLARDEAESYKKAKEELERILVGVAYLPSDKTYLGLANCDVKVILRKSTSEVKFKDGDGNCFITSGAGKCAPGDKFQVPIIDSGKMQTLLVLEVAPD